MRRAAADRARLLRICVCLQLSIPAWLASPAAAQGATPLDIVHAEAHGAASCRDLLFPSSATPSGDSDTAGWFRALGLERPSALPDILLQLRHCCRKSGPAPPRRRKAQGFKTKERARGRLRPE